MLDEALKAMGDCDLILILAPITDKVSHYEDFLVIGAHIVTGKQIGRAHV